MSVLSEIFRDNKFRPEDLPGFEGKLFFEGDKQRPFLVKFFVLVLLSTIIAVYGVLNDSPATVIGAMIVAPPMTPILATSAALVIMVERRTKMKYLTRNGLCFSPKNNLLSNPGKSSGRNLLSRKISAKTLTL